MIPIPTATTRPLRLGSSIGSLLACLVCLVASPILADDEALRWTTEAAEPDGTRLVTLDGEATVFDRRLDRAWTAPEGATLGLPLADGSIVEVRLERSHVMPDSLAERFPTIRAFRGAVVDRPGWSVRAESTPSGFRAQLARPDGETLFLTPRPAESSASTKGAFRLAPRSTFDREPFHCGVAGQVTAAALPEAARAEKLSIGPTIRTYRLAVAATGEYTRFHGGTVESGLAAIVTAVNRLNAIFRQDLAVRFALSPRNDELVFTNPNTDPFTGDDLGAILDENLELLDSTLGAGAYDLGHVFHNGGGGVAALGSVCTVFKAAGVSGIGRPIGDPFVAEYVAHEIG
ncbi:MAG: reprolysin-like metallopeptidase, partial [Acidobacteriota bacterium]